MASIRATGGQHTGHPARNWARIAIGTGVAVLATVHAIRLLLPLAWALLVLLHCSDARADSRVLYLNRCADEPVIWPAWEDDSVEDLSSVLDVVAVPPPYPYGYSSWRQVVATTRRLFAPFDVEVTDEDPGDWPHDEVFVCGAPWHADLDPGFWGLAPFHCEPPESAVSFVFPEAIGNSPEEIGETVAQEAAHAWGLDHSLSCKDPMSYAAPCGERSFQDRDLACGEYFARPCGCGGDQQNTYERLAEVLGERDFEWAAARAPERDDQLGCRMGTTRHTGSLLMLVLLAVSARSVSWPTSHRRRRSSPGSTWAGSCPQPRCSDRTRWCGVGSAGTRPEP